MDAVTKAKRSHTVQAAASEIVVLAKRDKAPVAINKISRILASVADNAIQEERQDWIKALGLEGDDMIENWDSVIKYAEQCKASEVTTRKMTPEERLKYGKAKEAIMGKRGPQPGFKNKGLLISESELELQEVAKVTKCAVPGTEKVAKVTKSDDLQTTNIQDDWDLLAAQTKGAVLQERAGFKYPDIKPQDPITDDTDLFALHEKGRPASIPYIREVAVNVDTVADHLDKILNKGEPAKVEGNNKADMHKAICKGLNNLYVRKNHDYGDSFSETYRKLGIISAVTRISDKVNRLQSLATKEQLVNDESIVDTLRDLANYAIMTIIELEATND